jgi:hypothetical protein
MFGGSADIKSIYDADYSDWFGLRNAISHEEVIHLIRGTSLGCDVEFPPSRNPVR